MRTISQVVEEVLLRSPFLSEVLSEGVGNVAEIARRIRPDVEKRLLEEVSEQAIAMALHRFQKDTTRPSFGTRFLKRLHNMSVRSNLVEIVCPNTASLSTILSKLSTRADAKDSFVTVSRGLHETLIVLDAHSESLLAKDFSNLKGIERTGELSAITLHLPEESLRVPGVYYPLLKALASEGISFVELMSVQTEFSILFEDKDVDRAFSVLKRATS